MTNGWRFVLHHCLKWKREHRCDLGSRQYRITLLLHTVTQRHECGPAFILSTGIKGSRVGSFFVCGRENQTGGSHEELNEKLALFYHINMQHMQTVAACLVGSAVLCPPPPPTQTTLAPPFNHRTSVIWCFAFISQHPPSPKLLFKDISQPCQSFINAFDTSLTQPGVTGVTGVTGSS